MPRPKKDPTEVLKLEIRITPADAQPITDWKIGDDFIQLIAAEEGGDGDTRLHYHCYLETLRSRSWIVKWIYSIAHCYNGETGNSVFFSRKPHENTLGYVVKHGNIAVRHGCEETFITEWLSKSAEYRRSRDTAAKKTQRANNRFTRQVKKVIDERLSESPDLRTPYHVIQLMKDEYRSHNRMYPNRTIAESLVCSCLDPYTPQLVDAFYLRVFEPRY